MKNSLAAAIAIAVCAASVPAQADILGLTVEAHAGGAGGQGVNGDLKDEAFSKGAAGATYGGSVGIEVAFIDFAIGHDQYVPGDGNVRTWTTFFLGVDTNFDLSRPEGGTRDKQGRMKGGYARWYSELGFGFGAGLGTGQQVEPPLDNGEVTDKGFLFRTQLGLGYRFTKQLSLAASVPMEARYMFKDEPGDVINDEGTHYQSFAVSLLLGLRMDISLL